MRTPTLFLFLVAAVGCGTDATVSGVFPAEGFTGRTLRVELSGDATEWSGTPGVNFGQGVTVSNVTVASPTSLFADITIASDATLGTRDVTVTNDGTFTLKSSFLIESPIEVSFDGMVAQGGAPYFTINNRDFETPFDLASGDTPSGFANLVLTAPDGVNFLIDDATPYQLKGYVLIDTDAAPGPLSVSSGTKGKEVAFNLGANVDVTARSPMALTDSATGTLAAMGDSALYSVSVSAVPSLMRVVATTSDADGRPVAAALPGGSWRGATSAAFSIAETSGTTEIVVFDAGTAGGYNYAIKSKIEALTMANEATTTNDTPGAALVASALPFTQTNSSLSAGTDKDVIRIVLTAPAVVNVHAFADDDSTDTAVDILSNAAGNPSVLTNYDTTPVDEGICFSLFGIPCGEDVTSPMLQAGTYYIVVSAGGSYDVSAKDYAATIYLN